MTDHTESAPPGPVLFAYDGSALARHAIERATQELTSGRRALVVCVWQPTDVGFIPANEQHFNAQNADQVRQAAEQTAAEGATFATTHGFQAESLAYQASPTWQGIIQAADDHRASLIVLGTHHRHGLIGHLAGSVTAAVLGHTNTSVLVVHQPPVTL